LIELIIAHAMAALLSPVLVRFFKRGAYWLLALVPAATAGWAALQTQAVLAGEFPTQTYRWVPELGLEISFRMDVLSWLMTLIVGGVGTLILIYCSGYFSKGAANMGRFAGCFVAFAGAMLGLVTTDNTMLLYLFWELTTVFSFLLIGHYHERQASRRAAMQAITVTTLGGLCMLVGLVMLGVAPAGSFTISELITNATTGLLVDSVPQHYTSAAAALLLVGAFTKSAQIPTHFWLPAAMAAPTPVSGYLHSSAMVKAGIYLVARFTPGFGDLTIWHWSIIFFGLGTMLFGGWQSLKQFDLKLLLAYGTVSQLGFIMVLVGFGSQAVMLAGMTMLLGHALFKATLFLTVGAIDHEFNTRDLRQLSNVWKATPGLMILATIAAASMAGLPPLLGFVGKEGALAALYDEPDTGRMVFVVIIVGSIITMAYTLRFWWGAFAPKPRVADSPKHRVDWRLLAPICVLTVASVAFGFMSHALESAFTPYAQTLPGEPGHLALWAGFTPALWATVIVIVAGIGLFNSVGRRMDNVGGQTNFISAEDAYRAVINTLNDVASDVTAFVQRGSLPSYLATMFGTMISGVAFVLMFGDVTWPSHIRLWDSPMQAVIAALACVAAVMVVRARRRMKAVLLTGFVGYMTAMLFAIGGAPDLALTQTLVETVTLVVFILVIRRLPSHFSHRPWLRSRLSRIALGAGVGLTTMVLAWFASAARIHEPVTVHYPEEVYQFGYGKNIVNVTLVDTRAWDTIGEISVLLAAATGIASLIFLRNRNENKVRSSLASAVRSPQIWDSQRTDKISAIARPEGLVDPKRGRVWLAGSLTLASVRRSLIFELGARIIFHPLLVFSLFLLFSGHNLPGGGFAGGVLAGIALTIRYLAGGRYELALASREIRPGVLLGSGMAISVLAALTPVVFGGTILQTTVWDFHLPIFNDVHLASALFFDIGVYLIVIGLVLDILTSLGSEIDRQAEAQGEQAPMVAYDDPTELSDDSIGGVDMRSDEPLAATEGSVE